MRKLIIYIAAAIIVIVLIFVLRPHEEGKKTASEPVAANSATATSNSSKVDLTQAAAAAAEANRPSGAQNSGIAPNAELSEQDLKLVPGHTVKIKAGQPLAMVNGRPVTLKDLVPAVKEGDERELSEGMYKFLLERAIERELVFQQAEAAGLTLTDEQTARLEELYNKDDEARQDPAVFDWMGRTAANAEFEVLDLVGTMMQANLAAQAGAPPQYVTHDDVVHYLESNPNVYPGITADSIPTDVDLAIRQKLSVEQRNAFQTWLRRYMETLKADADIKITPPAS